MGVTPQQECISDPHRVVDVQIKLKVTVEFRNNMVTVIERLLLLDRVNSLFFFKNNMRVLPAFLFELQNRHFSTYQTSPFHIC